MPQPLSTKEIAFLKLILPHLGPDKKVRYMKLRLARVPEETAQIFASGSDYLDSLVNRRLQALEKAGWVSLDNSTITVLHEP